MMITRMECIQNNRMQWCQMCVCEQLVYDYMPFVCNVHRKTIVKMFVYWLLSSHSLRFSRFKSHNKMPWHKHTCIYVHTECCTQAQRGRNLFADVDGSWRCKTHINTRKWDKFRQEIWQRALTFRLYTSFACHFLTFFCLSSNFFPHFSHLLCLALISLHLVGRLKYLLCVYGTVHVQIVNYLS